MNLKQSQKIALVAGLFLVSLIGLFPPLISKVDVLDNATNEVRPGYTEPAGRQFVFAPVKAMISQKNLIITSGIDYARLSVEWLVIAFLTASVLGLIGIVDTVAMALQTDDRTEARAA
jgi:hypothetical protein